MPKVAKNAPERPQGASKAKVRKTPTKAPKRAKNSQKNAFEAYFLKLDQDDFLELCKKWNNAHLNIDLPNLNDYDEWLNYFKSLTINKIVQLSATGKDVLSVEAFSALSLWHDMIKNPHRIGKIHQTGLTNKKDGEKQSITELAAANDQIGVLKALRDEVAEKLERGTGARDTATLARELGAIIEQIADAERKAGPKKDTVLGQLLGVDGVVENTTKKRAAKKKGPTGARKGRYAEKLTVEDMD